ncbi:MAG: hypothetical protein GEU28_10895 [Dehalococcoidia bacterium]|nr:hypothetical protein [Dehalococcoidia bacterium]
MSLELRLENGGVPFISQHRGEDKILSLELLYNCLPLVVMELAPMKWRPLLFEIDIQPSSCPPQLRHLSVCNHQCRSPRPVRAGSVRRIGKEANRLDEVEVGMVHDVEEVVLDYTQEPDLSQLIQALRALPQIEVSRRSGVSVRTIREILAGRALPRRRTIEALREGSRLFAPANHP